MHRHIYTHAHIYVYIPTLTKPPPSPAAVRSYKEWFNQIKDIKRELQLQQINRGKQRAAAAAAAGKQV